jgi:uncharacterized membrane protein YdbT with pleckstrin-like domain
MAAIALPYPHQLTFRPFQPWLWLQIGVLLILTCGTLALVALLGELRGLVIPIILALQIALLICRYRAQAIIISGVSLICRRGVLRVRERTIPLARVNYEIRQTLLGRIFDYGTVRVAANGEIIEIRRVASVHALQNLITERQTELYMAPYGWRLLDGRMPRRPIR